MKFIKKPFILLSALTLTLSLYSSAMADQPAPQEKSTASNVSNPVVTGPIPSSPLGDPSHNYPQLATSIDLDKYGYIEEEFFFEGKAARYSTAQAYEIANPISTDHPYKSRMLVRRPASPEKFNGKVIVEWLNVTSGYNLDAMWMSSYDHFLREGYAYVGVSAQRVGVHQGDKAGEPTSGLRAWSPVRYASLDVTDGGKVVDDGLAFDIYSQAAQAVLHPVGVNPLGNLKPEMMIAAGASQSESYLVRYYNKIHPLTNIFDGYMMYLGTGNKLRTDLDTKVIKVNTENDLITLGEVAARQDDSNVLRTYEVAGASHVGGGSDYRTNILIRDHLPVADISVCQKPALSRVPTGYVVNAAYEHLVRWIEDGIAPPKGERIKVQSTSPVVIARDSNGNALGGIRLPQHAVPTATNTGMNSGGGFCYLFGSHEPFSAEKLKSLYRNHGSYVSAVTQAANDVIKQGFLLKEDAKKIREEAAQSKVGK
ncbi:alpha/beta hydrolase domain-containing protein [Neobacillus niacini]|uniref:alpha/beta hydrolase domain-containing protein n=1 Tax=Neobacillus niacini TaxID=86668 RepID=UPI0021CB1AA2|nr:alpha/beta hydrolase domain-containing protein [Neobacillus niacini]MCM3768289.1 alpha/beta hydrolase domain-containing protein [Neobacillus niacini]